MTMTTTVENVEQLRVALAALDRATLDRVALALAVETLTEWTGGPQAEVCAAALADVGIVVPAPFAPPSDGEDEDDGEDDDGGGA